MSATTTSPCRAAAKQKVADSWAHRRKSLTTVSSDTADSKVEQSHQATAIPLCRVVRNVWEQLSLDVSQRLQSYRRSHGKERPLINTNTRPRVFPSVLNVLKASAVSSQVVESLNNEINVVMSVLPEDYNFDSAIQSASQTRERAFLLLDLSAVCKTFVELRQTFGNNTVELQYCVKHNRDAKLLELCVRLGIGLRTSSNMDVEAASRAIEKQSPSHKSLMVDDAGATRKPNGYLRRFIKQQADGYSSCCLAVDGPDEVKRINDSCKRFRQRRDLNARSKDDSESLLEFLLRLPKDQSEWRTLVDTTMQACKERNSKLVGVSVDLQRDDKDYLQQLYESLQTIAPLIMTQDYPTMRVDVTGVETQDVASFVRQLASSSFRVTVDASSLLVAHAGALCTRIIGIKEVMDDDNGEEIRRHLYIDDGCYGSLYNDWTKRGDSENDVSNHHTPLPLLDTKSSDTQTTTVWGPTCDGLDRVCKNVVLPKMQVDEWLVFPDMGLAGGKGTSFNGFDPPDVIYCVLGYFRRLQ